MWACRLPAWPSGYASSRIPAFCGAIGIDLDAVALGYPLTAIVRIRQLPGQLRKVEALIRATPEFIECDMVTGDDCFVARAVLREIGDLERIMAPLADYAETNTAIVKSNTVRRRPPPFLAIAVAKAARRDKPD